MSGSKFVALHLQLVMCLHEWEAEQQTVPLHEHLCEFHRQGPGAIVKIRKQDNSISTILKCF